MYLCRCKLHPGDFSPIGYVTTDGCVPGHCFSPYKPYSYHMIMNKQPTKSILSRLVFCVKDNLSAPWWLLHAVPLLWKLQAEFGKEQRKRRQETGTHRPWAHTHEGLEQYTNQLRQTQALTLKQGLQSFCILLQVRVPLGGYYRTNTCKA